MGGGGALRGQGMVVAAGGCRERERERDDDNVGCGFSPATRCVARSSLRQLRIRPLHVPGETWYVVSLSALHKASTTWLIGDMRGLRSSFAASGTRAELARLLSAPQ